MKGSFFEFGNEVYDPDAPYVGQVFRVTTSTTYRDFSRPLTDFKMVAIMIVESGTDGISHRIVQWVPGEWIKYMIETQQDLPNKRLVYNFIRSETSRRVWAWFTTGNPNRLNVVKQSTASDTYSVVVWGIN